jgi:hypothetical protein
MIAEPRKIVCSPPTIGSSDTTKLLSTSYGNENDQGGIYQYSIESSGYVQKLLIAQIDGATSLQLIDFRTLTVTNGMRINEYNSRHPHGVRILKKTDQGNWILINFINQDFAMDSLLTKLEDGSYHLTLCSWQTGLLRHYLIDGEHSKNKLIETSTNNFFGCSFIIFGSDSSTMFIQTDGGSKWYNVPGTNSIYKVKYKIF